MDDRSFFDALRSTEFARIRGTYLDHTGAALYPASLVRDHALLLADAVLGNPHSDSPASRASTAAVDQARASVLTFLDADPGEYEVILTANASGAIRLVAEAFPFTPASRLVLSADNHNSVNGVREFARRAGAELRTVPLDGELRLVGVEHALSGARRGVPHLFAYPAQSNFSGVRHSLQLVSVARDAGYRVLLDAAAFVPSSRLSLSQVPADFVALSFYKMFGYPTGIGALVARRDALQELRRPWFAGGTVEFVSTQGRTHLLRRGAEGFEDGTASFLAAPAVTAGLAFVDGIGMERLGRHIGELTRATLEGLAGMPDVRIYGPADLRDRGGTVAFNLLSRSGEIVDYREVERRAGERGVSLRGGCFCNPGAAERAFGFSPDAASRCFAEAAARGFDLDRLKACMPGVAVGALRVSFGMSSGMEDVSRLTDFLGESLVGVSAAA